MMEKNLIVAVADNGAIGRGGQMPWHLRRTCSISSGSRWGAP